MKGSKAQKAAGWVSGNFQEERINKALVLWGPHRTNRLRVVCVREHVSPVSGVLIPKGFEIPFCIPEHRNSWLKAQHPKKWGKLK